MIELGKLEQHHSEFAKRDVRVVVISNDDQPTAQSTQADFPHLVVVSDSDQSLAKSFQVLHPGVGPQGSDTNAPTTFFVDGRGNVRRFVRPTTFMTRLSPHEVLATIDAEFAN